VFLWNQSTILGYDLVNNIIILLIHTDKYMYLTIIIVERIMK
jgi:hypothetical protein